jgi:hypothetical protein
MKTTLTLLLLIAAMTASAQTRRIAQRSHSGTKNERYAKGESSYGYFPQTVTIHLESGKDTTVYEWDSLARPMFNVQPDTTPRAMIYPRDTTPKQDIREMGSITHRLIGKS